MPRNWRALLDFTVSNPFIILDIKSFVIVPMFMAAVNIQFPLLLQLAQKLQRTYIASIRAGENRPLLLTARASKSEDSFCDFLVTAK